MVDRRVDDMTTTEVLETATKVQDESKESVQRTLALGYAAQSSGAAALQQLDENAETIQRIHEHADNIQSEMARAGKELRAFIRRQMTDKFVLLFMFLIFVGVIVSVAVGGEDETDPRPIQPSKLVTANTRRGRLFVLLSVFAV